MKLLLFSFGILFFIGCKTPTLLSENKNRQEVSELLNHWHQAAAEANFDKYFGLMTTDAVFIGTDATENWNRKDFEVFSKPYFDKGKAWNFKCLERHIFIDESQKIAWFDELLNTQMKICRGSGVVVKENNQWKVKHYVLSMTIPNDNSAEVIKIKASIEDSKIKILQEKMIAN